jgi:membrane protein YqaA with SNARE-associated domain
VDSRKQAFELTHETAPLESENKKRMAGLKPGKLTNWLKLAILALGFVILSFSLAYLIQNLIVRFHLPLYDLAWLAYIIVFGFTLVANATIIVPVPFAASIMIAAATKWNPILIAMFGSMGGALGEMVSYYAGYWGRKIATSDRIIGYGRIEGWIRRYGAWAIFFLAFQPIIPFDIGALIAGAARMPIRRFMPALWWGKFLKYIILVYAGIGLIHFLPFWG